MSLSTTHGLHACAVSTCRFLALPGTNWCREYHYVCCMPTMTSSNYVLNYGRTLKLKYIYFLIWHVLHYYTHICSTLDIDWCLTTNFPLRLMNIYRIMQENSMILWYQNSTFGLLALTLAYFNRVFKIV